MEKIGDILKKKIIVNNDIKNNLNNDNNVNKKYVLNKTKFTPNTKKTVLAEKIASNFNDLNNYACYLSVVNKLGVMDAERLYRSTLDDIKEKMKTEYPVRNKAKYFMYKYKNKIY